MEKILRDRSAIEGERRTVTVLFIDAVGSMSAAERVDEEALHRAVHDATERMIEAVNRFEGTVTQFRGDGIMAIFGAPIAHEDSARRAVAAALAMRESLNAYADELRASALPSFVYRIGLNTGPVVVGSIGNDLTMDYTAVGDTVNLAARMEQSARPNGVYITRNTQRLVSAYFELTDLGLLEVKGKAEGVHAYEVMHELAARTRLDASAARGLTPFVGRDDQLAQLRAHFGLARMGEGQVVIVSGEAGMGKSRLLLEFRQQVEDEAAWLEGRCISWGNNFPFLPIVEIVRGALGVEEGDDDTAIARRVDEQAERWGEEARAAAPYLKYLLRMELFESSLSTMDPVERRARIFDALRTLLRHVAQPGKPAVVVVEDLHWVDEHSEEALSVLIDAVPATPVLLVVTHRPGFAHRLGERTYYNRLALRNLAAEYSASMVSGVLKGSGIPRELQQLIVSKAEGNPFYIEEVSRSLVESGVLRRQNGGYALARPVDEIRIPDTVQEVILSRLDRLDRGARDAVQRAAVIGREFPVRLLERVSEATSGMDTLLGELKALELIYEKSYFPELAYMFKHALTQDVALSTLLADRRQALHRTVAVAIEDLYADRLQEHHEALAYHYYQGEEWEKACEYGTLVALRAEALYAPRAVIDHATRAIDAAIRCADCAEEVDPRLYSLRAAAYEAIGEFDLSRADHEAALASARERKDARAEWQAYADLGMLWAGRDYDETGTYFERAHEMARAIGDESLVAASLNRLGNWRGNNTEDTLKALREHEEALQIFEQLQDKRGIAETLDFMLMAYAFCGDMKLAMDAGQQSAALFRELEDQQRLAGALASLAFAGPSTQAATLVPMEHDTLPEVMTSEAREIARSIGWRAGEIYARLQSGIHLLAMGQYRQALQDVREGLSMAREIGHTQWETGMLTLSAEAYGSLFDVAEAIRCGERAYELANAIGSQHWKGCSLGTLTSALIEFGDLARAEALLDETLTPGMPMISITQRTRWAMKADLLQAQGEPAAAIAILDALGATAKNAGNDGVRAVSWLAWRRGRANLTLGRMDEANSDLEAAAERAEHFGTKPLQWRALGAVGELRLLQHRDDEAQASFRRALAIIDELASEIDDPALRATFCGSTHVQRVREGAGVAGAF